MLQVSLAVWLLASMMAVPNVCGDIIAMEERYLLRSCEDNMTKYIAHGGRSGVYQVRSLIDCVSQCQQNDMCNYAMYEEPAMGKFGICQFVFSIFKNNNETSDLHSEESLLSGGNYRYCGVISRKSSLSTVDVINISNVKKLELLPTFAALKMDRNEGQQTEIENVSEIKISNDQVSVAMVSHTVSYTQQFSAYNRHLRNKIFRLYSTPNIIFLLSDSYFIDGRLLTSILTEMNPTSFNIFTKLTRYESVDGLPKVTVAYTVDDVIECLLNGYRRLVNHPSSIHLDISNKLIHFEMQEVVKASFNLREKAQVWVYVVKETIGRNVSLSERYHIPFGYNSRRTSTVDILPPLLPWVFENDWEKVVATDGDSIYNMLKEIVLQGRELRVLQQGEVSADTTTVTVFPDSDDIVVTLALVAMPTSGKDAASSPEEIRLHSIALTATGSRLLCSYLLHARSTVSTENLKLSNISVTWFASTKTWDKKLVIDETKRVTFGSKSELISLAESGYTVRVCVVKATDIIICFTPTSLVTHAARNRINSQSMPFNNPELMFQESLQDSRNNLPDRSCSRVYLTVWSDGYAAQQEAFYGATNQPQRVIIKFKRIEWFVEAP